MREFKDLPVFVDNICHFLGVSHLSGILANQDNINKTLDLLSDDSSKDLLLREMALWAFSGFLRNDIALRYYGGMSQQTWNNYLSKVSEFQIHSDIEYPPSDTWVENYTKATTFLVEQYRYEDKIKVEEGDICLDVGACVGDTSIWMIENGAYECYAFEVDKSNIKYLNNNIKKNDKYNKIHIIDKGCSSSNQTFFYVCNEKNVGGGRIYKTLPDNISYYEVECVTIDSYCKEHNIAPTFIKMDIEGAEIEAIKGAENVIREYRPKIAICVYHAWTHRWEIPLLLNSIINDYEFYLKKSTPNVETVLLGRPKK